MNCIFGPVQSRRLGRSLGIDLFRTKLCNLNCIYCEVGRTLSPVGQRSAYSDTTPLLAEIDQFCADSSRLAEVDVVTVTAKGEPTLHSDLGRILRHLKQVTNKPIAVLTNGTTLGDPQVQADLMAADIIIPSLDAARQSSFRAIDRPMPGLHLDAIINGLTTFTHAYTGKLWLEILLAQGVNDAPEDIEALIAAIHPMRVDRLQLNTVVRPPAEDFALPVAQERLAVIASQLQQAKNVPVDLPFAPPTTPIFPDKPAAVPAPAKSASMEPVIRDILAMLQRRPCTAADIDRTFHLNGPAQVEHLLEPLLRSGCLHCREQSGLRYYQCAA